MPRSALQAGPAARGFVSVDVHVGDGRLGWKAGGPYDAVIVTAGGRSVPSRLLEPLVVGGRLAMPVGGIAPDQQVLVYRREPLA